MRLTHYTFNGHTITLDTAPLGPASSYHAADSSIGGLNCNTASIPYTIARAVFFMAEHNVRSLIIDGVEVKRV